MRRVLTIFFSAIVGIALIGSLWWWQNGLKVLYRQFSPSTEQLIGDQEVPRELSVDQWKADIDTLSSTIKQRLIYFEDAYGATRLARRVDSLKPFLSEQSRAQRILSVAHLLNVPAPGNKHTGLSFVQRPLNWTLMPVNIYEFDDGYYIVDAVEEELIGHKVLSIGGMPIDSAASRLAPWGIPAFAEPFRATRVVDKINNISLRLESPSGNKISRNVEPQGALWSPTILFYAKSLKEPIKGEWSPGHTNPRKRNYWLSYRDSTDLLYLQFNSVQHSSSEWTIGDLADSLETIVSKRPLDKMVVDIRNNGGGNHHLVEPLVDLLGNHPKIDQQGTLYALISPRTFSAAGTFAMELERRTKTIFVGEPAGFTPNMWGDTVPFVLPNSKLVGDVSYRYWQTGMPDSPRNKLTPDISVPLTSEQHFSNIDSAMIAVRQHEPDLRKLASLSPKQRKSFSGIYRLSPIHRARVTETSDGLHLHVDRGRHETDLHPFIESNLYPLSQIRLTTDITDVYLKQRIDSKKLSLVWKDTTYALIPVDSTFTLPTEDLRAGRFEQAAKRLRSAYASGFKLDGWINSAIRARADTLEEMERPQDALRYAKLGVELFPESWRSYSRLGYTYEALEQPDNAIKAYKKLQSLDPRRSNQVQEKLEKLRNKSDS